MDPDDLLFQAAAQTIDALSFSQTHVIDRDFRAHSRATIDSVRSLQREQRNRVDDTYGPRNPTVDTVAAQLLASYRGEIGLLELSHEGEESRSLSPSGVVTTPLVMAGMTHSKCLLFKREMKQRIHEWERAFREERGVAVTAHEKGALRQVYELYKTAKNRLRDNSPHSGSEQNPSHTLGFQQRQQGATLYGGCQVEGDAEGEAPGSMGWNSSTVSHYGHIDDHSVSTGMPGSSMAHTSTPRQSQAADEPIETADVSSPTAGKGIPASHMSNEELAVEKRNLKRVLHKFESKFEQRHGYAPTKNDRRSLAREYTRYGELKNEILRRSSGSNAHHDGSDEGSRGMSSNLPG
ncbi:hypothetical protein ERJ75_001337000 [Trypanosoma vivax]|uniref:FAM13A-like domain-containing protein n=1 Tax=Trypanosoma vivax (strain Y486) TaxID=1055687 RepID=G0U654_TRYVY|nr:hypothetical protein TRVL_06825 [Trypanosoma vivax]KAH8608169.1 hypothetical protein ERJ75_001337000 [Trypanosoma vivax]CCC51357.1 conserved hypothetical protein [Trypanosoma vivax Y486]